MRVRVVRIDDRPTYLPLPQSGELEINGRLWPEYLYKDGRRVYLSLTEGEYTVILDGTLTEFEEALKRSQEK